MATRKFFVGGNFKMNPSNIETKMALLKSLNEATLDPSVEVVVAPPSLYLIPVLELLRKDVKVAAQNSYVKASGAFTGEISPCQLHDAGVPFVILGHSERRTLFHETSQLVAEKTKAAIDAGLTVILCVGETLEEREGGKTAQVTQAQLGEVVNILNESEWNKVVIAYEPVWAIGTGKVASSAQAQDAHRDIRTYISTAVSPAVADQTRIIYGGSVNAKNAPESAAQPDVDGFLVGGASLKPEFADIVNAGKVKSKA